MSEELVGRETEEDGVEILVLRHPPVNALQSSLLDALAQRVSEIETSPTSRVVILTGDGQVLQRRGGREGDGDDGP